MEREKMAINGRQNGLVGESCEKNQEATGWRKGRNSEMCSYLIDKRTEYMGMEEKWFNRDKQGASVKVHRAFPYHVDCAETNVANF